MSSGTIKDGDGGCEGSEGADDGCEGSGGGGDGAAGGGGGSGAGEESTSAIAVWQHGHWMYGIPWEGRAMSTTDSFWMLVHRKAFLRGARGWAGSGGKQRRENKLIRRNTSA